MMDIKSIDHAVSGLGLTLSEDQLLQLQKYYDLVIEKNKVMNLTAITDEKEFLIKHFVDSLSIVRLFSDMDDKLNDKSTNDSLNLSSNVPLVSLSADQQLSVIDIGTGAGFPGIVLKIAFPKWKVTLFDSLQKRVSFLSDTIQALGLEDITAVHGRAEDFGKREEYREQYSLCVSRAVANISTLLEYCLPFVSVGGMFVAYKSAEYSNEVSAASNAIELLGGRLEKVEQFILPEIADGRSLVCIRKDHQTPGKYPRKAGMPSKHPL